VSLPVRYGRVRVDTEQAEWHGTQPAPFGGVVGCRHRKMPVEVCASGKSTPN
jgi:hypothetical protein